MFNFDGFKGTPGGDKKLEKYNESIIRLKKLLKRDERDEANLSNEEDIAWKLYFSIEFYIGYQAMNVAQSPSDAVVDSLTDEPNRVVRFPMSMHDYNNDDDDDDDDDEDEEDYIEKLGDKILIGHDYGQQNLIEGLYGATKVPDNYESGSLDGGSRRSSLVSVPSANGL